MAEILDFRPPHPGEDHIISIVAGDTQYRWAVHEPKSHFPVVCWRTSTIRAREVELATTEPCELVLRYLPEEALTFVFGANTTAKQRTKERASLYRATQRVPAISIYCMVPNEHNNKSEKQKRLYDLAEEHLSYMFRDIPCNFYKLKLSDMVSNTPAEDYQMINIEQFSMLKAVDDILKDRCCLIVDGGATLKFICTEPKPETKQEARSFYDAELNAIRVTRESQTISLTSKLRIMNEKTGALPFIGTKQVQKYLQDLRENKEKIKWFHTNTVDAMMACALQETALFLRSMVKTWALSNSNNNSLVPVPLVCFTGMESEILNKLLGPSSDGDSCELEGDYDYAWTWTKAPPGESLQEGSKLLQIRSKHESSVVVLVEVRTERHLVHHGIQDVLSKQQKKHALENDGPVGTLQQKLIGCRMAKTFESENGDDFTEYRGQVMSVNNSRQSKVESADDLTFMLRYDDGDIEEMTALHLYGELTQLCCSAIATRVLAWDSASLLSNVLFCFVFNNTRQHKTVH